MSFLVFLCACCGYPWTVLRHEQGLMILFICLSVGLLAGLHKKLQIWLDFGGDSDIGARRHGHGHGQGGHLPTLEM